MRLARRGRLGEVVTSWDADSPTAKGFPEVYALALAHAGRTDEARRAAGAPTPIRHDYAFDLSWGIRGLLAVAVQDPARAETAYDALLPFPDRLAAAGTAVLVLAPTAQILGDLAVYRGDPEAAVRHYRQAVDVAARAGADHWVRRATQAASALGPT
ncbi:hypothetical protein [Jannaschia sp. R86511]|uniref:hypothetical protein n=1 Tax=Jannaschia sp. R86511 TaxID=3093853 RepID=UPI0036D43CDF